MKRYQTVMLILVSGSLFAAFTSCAQMQTTRAIADSVEERAMRYVDIILGSPILRGVMISRLAESKYLKPVVESVVTKDCQTSTEPERDQLRETLYEFADGSYVVVVCVADKKKALLDAALIEYEKQHVPNLPVLPAT